MAVKSPSGSCNGYCHWSIGGVTISKKKVFVVDDEVQIAEVLALGLREAELDAEAFYGRPVSPAESAGLSA